MTGVAERVAGWIRPHIAEASDGIITSAGVSEGFAGAGADARLLAFAGLAVVVAGALAACAVEYAQTGAELDRQEAQLELERQALTVTPEAELDELTDLYVSRGLSRGLARKVAVELSEHDALAAHADVEYDIPPGSRITPVRNALAVGVAFMAGAVLPWPAIILIPGPPRAAVTFVIVLVALVLTGWVSAKILGVHPTRPVFRTAVIGVVSMALTFGGGLLFRAGLAETAGASCPRRASALTLATLSGGAASRRPGRPDCGRIPPQAHRAGPK